MGHTGFALYPPVTPSVVGHETIYEDQSADSFDLGDGYRVATLITTINVSSEPPEKISSRAKVVDEIVSHLLAHNGPDEDGMAHPALTRLRGDVLLEAIAIAKVMGLEGNWRPYHFRASLGVYDLPGMVDEVIRKKISRLLSQKYGGDLFSLLQNTYREELTAPLVEEINGRTVVVSLETATRKIGRSAFPIISRYIELCGLAQEFWGLRPYHLARTSHGALDDPLIREELLGKKIDYLLRTKYEGNLVALIRNTSQEEMMEPIVDEINGHLVEVGVGTIVTMYRSSPFEMVSDYIRCRGLTERFRGLTSNHFRKAAAGTFSDPEVIDDLIMRKIDQLLSTKYESLADLIQQTSRDELFSPLIDEIDGQPLEISMQNLTTNLHFDRFSVISRYIELKGLTHEYWGFRPYHLCKTTKNSYDDPAFCTELIVKKIDGLLRDKYHGGLVELICSTSAHELAEPFSELLGGHEVEVSMTSAMLKFGSSPFRIISHYIAAMNLQEAFQNLRPYHFHRAGNNTFSEPAIIDELTLKIMGRLRNDRYGGSFHELIINVNHCELNEPFCELLNGQPVEVSTGRLMYEVYHNSTFEILQHYFELLGKPFPYTRACIVGSPENRERRISGKLSDWDLKKMKRPDGSYDSSLFGFAQFSSEGKALVRDLMIEIAFDTFLDQEIRYLGLETEQLTSVRMAHDYLNLDLSRSVVFEREPRTFNAMRAMQKGAAFPAPIRDLQITPGAIEDRLPALPGWYNLINLDYRGSFSASKERALAALFENDHLPDRALIFITVADDALNKSRPYYKSYAEDQAAAVTEALDRLSGTRYTVTRLYNLPYRGGTQETPGLSMLALGFEVARRRGL